MMKNMFRLTFAALLGSILGLGSAVSQAATGTGPYYAEPSWDQKLACTTPATCPRFIVLTDWNSEAVLDRETGLVWEQSPVAATQNWSNAIFHCISRRVGGRAGWHLPLVEQLQSLLEFSSANASLPTGHPFSNVQSGEFWSATTAVENPSAAWVLGLSGDSGFVLKTAALRTWCVRGGQSFDGNTHSTLH